MHSNFVPRARAEAKSAALASSESGVPTLDRESDDFELDDPELDEPESIDPGLERLWRLRATS
jgi:hypothetical protein